MPDLLQFSKKALSTQIHLFFYILFAFQSNLVREIIKDLQDYEGDVLAVNTQLEEMGFNIGCRYPPTTY